MKPERVNILYSLGRPFAPLYGAIMNVRAALYHKNILKKTSLEVPVISVGNLTMGGTGKTPMAIYLAGLMRKKNPVVVSRGYHGTSTDKINVVSDGNSLLMGVREAGDESYLMARALPGIPVVTGRSKRLTAEYAVRHFNPGLVIVDDGFQHLGLARDLNMVMFKVDTLLGNNRVFPAGDMREPLKALE
ncbi:MAG: tetraacyldisaccharide 4'-kinase, partial [Desulfurivibrionaceae bacterium]